MGKHCVMPLSLQAVEAALGEGCEIAVAGTLPCVLDSAFQPVFSLAHKRLVGMEALIRAADLQRLPVSPPELFSACSSVAELTSLDRMARFVHLRNFLALDDHVNWLFLNVHPEVVLHGKNYGSYFRELLERFDLPGHRVVVEIVEHPIKDAVLLQETVDYYKSLGCLIALDDFGVGGSNFERVWNLKPHVIKLDRSFIVRAGEELRAREILSDLTYLLRQAGCLVLVEGVETFEQALAAMEAGVDFVQGYHFAKPARDPLAAGQYDFDALFGRFKSFVHAEENNKRERLSKYQKLFEESVELLERGDGLDVAARAAFTEEKCVRCYLLTLDGAQVGGNVFSPNYDACMDPRFKPLEDTRKADWSRRFYLRRAVQHPGVIQVSRPYLSLTGAHMCVTLSKTVQTPAGLLVLCCDVDWE